jgi:hypothetical protein
MHRVILAHNLHKGVQMKTVNLLMILSLLITLPAHANGGRDGGGGAFVKANFMSKAETISQHLRIPGNNIHNVNLTKLDRLLGELDLSVSDTELKDKNDEPVDALNFPPTKLILYSPSWKNILATEETVYVLVYHELLSLLKIDDTNHKLSKDLKIENPQWGCFAYCAYNIHVDVVGHYYEFEPMMSEGTSAASAYNKLLKRCKMSQIPSGESGWTLMSPTNVAASQIIYDVTTMTKSCLKNN